MTIFTDGLRLESPDRPVSDFEASFGAQLGATAAQSWSDSPTSQLLGVAELDRAAGVDYSRFSAVDDAAAFGGRQEPQERPSVPSLSRADALDRVKQAGLEKHLTVPDQETIPGPVLDIMLARARDRAEREATIARGPQNIFAAGAGLGTSFLVGAIDPINIGSAFIPIMGELRYGKLLASAGESAIARAGVRTGVGAAQGVVGQALLEPLDWYAHTQEGRDFGMSDVLHNLAFGAALGGALHAGGGLVSDVVRTRQERPLYPYDLGEPLAYHTPWEDLRERPVAPAPLLGEFPGLEVEATARPAAPIEILRDLPPQAQEDSMRAALAAIVDGEPVKVGEMLNVAAETDPRVAESLKLEAPTLTDRGFVYDDVYRQLIGAGMPVDQARHNATVVAARYATRADRLGPDAGTPADLYRAEGIDIRRGDDAALELEGRSFNQAAIIDGLRVNFPDADHVALFELGRRLVKREKVDDAEPQRLLERFRGFMIEDPLDNTSLRNAKDLRAAARQYYEDVQEQVRKGRPFEAWDTIEPDLKADWYRRALDEAHARQAEAPAAYVRPQQLRLLQNGRRPTGLDLFAQREADGQMGLPGTERIGQGELAQRKADEPLKPGAAQKPLDIGLFGDDAAQKSLFQSGESPRGRITLSENGAIIDLFKGADHSTFMHEAGHLWLDELMRDAAHAKASEQLRADRRTVLDWLGVNDAGEIGVEQHEKWARGFERYLATGRAPSNVLAEAFEAFRRWLAEIYRSLAGHQQEISPEIRAVMDRMLATDAEIAERGAAAAPAKAKPDPDLVAKPKARGRGAAHPDTLSLNEHLASKGGLKPDPELEAIYGGKRGPFLPGFGPLIRKRGMTLDEALTSAKEHGYMFDPHDAENGTAGVGGRTSMGLTPRDLLDALDAENRGKKLYKSGHIEATKYDVEQERHVILAHVENEFEAAGLSVADIDPRLIDRTAEIVHREGERDVLAAYERAIIEDEERFNAIAADRDASDAHPLRDIPFDAGPAPGRGGTDPVTGGRAGRAEPGAGRADGSQPPRGGGRDRATLEAVAPSEEDWRSLLHHADELDHPDLLEASRAADEAPAVPSRLEERVAAAEKADADAAELYKMFANELPEADRARLEDAVKALDDDHKLDTDVIERAAACAFRARA